MKFLEDLYENFIVSSKNFKYNKIHLERNPFQFSNMAERLPFKKLFPDKE